MFRIPFPQKPTASVAKKGKATRGAALSTTKKLAKPIHKILYAEKPLSKGSEVFALTPKEYEEKFKCTYQGYTNYGSFQEDDQTNDNRTLAEAELTNQILDILQGITTQPSQKAIDNYFLYGEVPELVICDIDATVGTGLYARHDIPPGTIVGVYDGDVVKGSSTDGGHYQHALHGEYVINTKDAGSLMRHIQHLPWARPTNEQFSIMADPLHTQAILLGNNLKHMREDIEKGLVEEYEARLSRDTQKGKNFAFLRLEDLVDFPSPQTRGDIATANILVARVKIDGKTRLVCWAPYGIKKNEQLGYDYSFDYWTQAGCFPLLFDKHGEVLAKNLYCYKFSVLQYYAKQLDEYLRKVNFNHWLTKKSAEELREESDPFLRQLNSLIAIREELAHRMIELENLTPTEEDEHCALMAWCSETYSLYTKSFNCFYEQVENEAELLALEQADNDAELLALEQAENNAEPLALEQADNSATWNAGDNKALSPIQKAGLFKAVGIKATPQDDGDKYTKSIHPECERQFLF